jgi:hypothetical protein
MARSYRNDLTNDQERRTVIPVRREATIFGGWGVKV